MAQLLLLLLSLTATAAVTNLSLGMLFQLTDSNGVERATGRAIAASSLLAMTHFNSRNSSLIAAFGELGSCDVRLEVQPVVYNSQGDVRTTVQQFINGYSGWDAVVGPARSATTLPVARLGGILDIPQVGYWATSPSLNSADYPYFARTIPGIPLTACCVAGHALCSTDDTALNKARMAYFESVQWTRVGILYTSVRAWVFAGTARLGDRLSLNNPPDQCLL